MAEPEQAPASPLKLSLKRIAWVSTSYFAEGFPYTMVNSVANVLFTDAKASLQVIGLTSLFHLPWNLKFLWAAWVDTYETKRRWLLVFEVAIAALFVLLAISTSASAADDDSTRMLVLAAVLFTVIAAASATHDVAVDGFYLEALDEHAQAEFVGYRTAAYRVAMTAGLGTIVWIAGQSGWATAWIASALTMVVLTVFHALALPRPEARGQPIGRLLGALARGRVLVLLSIATALILAERRHAIVRPIFARVREHVVATIPPLGNVGLGDLVVLALLATVLAALAALPWVQRRLASGSSAFAMGSAAFLAKSQVRRILVFVILFRLGESFLQQMRTPFLMNELGLEMTFIGPVIQGFAGLAVIVASIAAGHLIARHGLRRWIWPFVIVQNVSNLAYLVPALVPTLSRTGITAVVMIENVGSGLGNAVLMVYIMRCCDPQHRAAHMAILTAIMSIGFTVAGVVSGYVAETLGWPLYFVFTFVAALPSMILLPFIPHLDGRSQ